jgi:hypothetical protein
MARLDEFDSKVVSTAATEIISTLAAQAAELVPQIRKAYKLDDQLVNLVLARAWVRCAVAAVSQVGSMSLDESARLEEQIHQAITNAIDTKRTRR